jgi:hypothetical protein
MNEKPMQKLVKRPIEAISYQRKSKEIERLTASN